MFACVTLKGENRHVTHVCLPVSVKQKATAKSHAFTQVITLNEYMIQHF